MGEVDAVKSQATQGEDFAKLDDSSTACLPGFDSSRMTFDPECQDCRLSFQYTKPDRLVMYLHAYRYQVVMQITYVNVQFTCLVEVYKILYNVSCCR